MSNSNYLSIYDFALVLNSRYATKRKNLHLITSKSDLNELKEDVSEFDKLSLKMKLSNIAQEKGFSYHLHKLGFCFVTTPSHKAPLRELLWRSWKKLLIWSIYDGEISFYV